MLFYVFLIFLQKIAGKIGLTENVYSYNFSDFENNKIV